jgi:peptide/nickel transport system substrate-binding protein
MINQYSRLRLKRKIRKHKERVVVLGGVANKHIDRHIFRRWHNLRGSYRFVIGWVGLLIILFSAVLIQNQSLGKYYLTSKPVAGGVYTEGMVGTFSNANPIYAVSDIDLSVSKLVFDPLLDYDKNNQLINDLAESYDVDSRGLTYTVRLRDGIKWHDGKALTADDVVFTFQTIQNPDAKSPFKANWTGVKIEKVDNKTIRFILPNAYSPFPHSLTTGIIPKHKLENIDLTSFRSHPFNTKEPIGSGPFVFESADINNADNKQETIQLRKSGNYHKGPPKLDGITLKLFKEEKELTEALNNNKIDTAAGLNMTDKEVDNKYKVDSFTMMSANMLFLKTTAPMLNNVKIRQALIKATNVPELLTKVGYPTVPVNEPILKSQIGYDSAYMQFGYNKKEAIEILETQGYKYKSGEKYRSKENVPLRLGLSYLNSPDFSRIAGTIQKQWAEVGVDLVINVSQDVEQTRKYINNHDYDILLYGINIGADPDVYAYWHSSQIDIKSQIHLNLSEYKSKIADLSLETARTRSDPNIRALKYKPFIEVWRNDVPAIGLYQPRYLYVANRQVYGMNGQTINTPSDRFNNVHEWMINTERQQSNK